MKIKNKKKETLKIEDKATLLNLLQQIALFQSQRTVKSFCECLPMATKKPANLQ
jgi:hypothetical protein